MKSQLRNKSSHATVIDHLVMRRHALFMKVKAVKCVRLSVSITFNWCRSAIRDVRVELKPRRPSTASLGVKQTWYKSPDLWPLTAHLQIRRPQWTIVRSVKPLSRRGRRVKRCCRWRYARGFHALQFNAFSQKQLHQFQQSERRSRYRLKSIVGITRPMKRATPATSPPLIWTHWTGKARTPTTSHEANVPETGRRRRWQYRNAGCSDNIAQFTPLLHVHATSVSSSSSSTASTSLS